MKRWIAALLALVLGCGVALGQYAPGQGPLVPSAAPAITGPVTVGDIPVIANGSQVQDAAALASSPGYATLPVGLNLTGNSVFSGTAIYALGAVTGGSGYTQSTIPLGLGALTGGSGYTPGVYTNVATTTSGAGTGLLATLVINSSGVVASFSIGSARGTGYAINDTLSVSTGIIGAGTGLSIPVSSVGYPGVPLTGGTGSGAAANITVSAGGAVTAAALSARGTGYTAADSLSASAASIGGTGSGFAVVVSSVAAINGPANANIYWQRNVSGTAACSQPCFVNYLIANSFQLAAGVAGGSIANQVGNTRVYSNIGGALNSYFTNFDSTFLLNSATGNTAVSGNYVAGVFSANATVVDNGTAGARKGSLWALNSYTELTRAALNYSSITAYEADLAIDGSSSADYVDGLQVVLLSNNVTPGTLENVAFIVGAQLNAVATMTCGYCYGGYQGNNPFAATATLMAYLPHAGVGSGPTITNGIDLTKFTFTGKAFQSTGWNVDGSGNETALSFVPSGSTVPANGLYLPGANNVGLATSTAGNTFWGNGTYGWESIGGNGVVNASDLLSVRTNNNAVASASLRNANAGVSAQAILYFANNTSNTEVSMTLNGGAFSGGLGANAFAINAVGGMWLQGNGTTSIQIDTSGNAFLTTAASDSGLPDATVCRRSSNGQLLAGSGTLGICVGTSGRQYKTGIEDIQVGIDQIMALHPRQFHMRDGYGDPSKLMYGFIADEALAALPNLVGFDADGTPNTFDYLGIVPPLVSAVQNHETRLQAIETRIR